MSMLDYFRETKQSSEVLYKLLSGLSQGKIRMTSQQQLFCQQVVERVSCHSPQIIVKNQQGHILFV